MKSHGRVSQIYNGLPPHSQQQRIGLYGGSFNPAHEGHQSTSLLALRRLKLDRIWWMVTPGNPLKPVAGLPQLQARMENAAKVAANPRIVISGAEAALSTIYTADFVEILRSRLPQVRFVWIMGSDNLAQFHRWERWREIAAAVPIAVVNRPGTLLAALNAPAAKALARFRVEDDQASTLALREPPAWAFLTGPRTGASSTALRKQRRTG